MSFLKIQDPKKREETIREYLAVKRKIQEQDMGRRLAEKNIYTQGEKLLKPLIDVQKETSEKLVKELEPLKQVRGLERSDPLKAIELPPQFKGVELGDIASKALSDALSKGGQGYDNIVGIYKNPTDGKFYIGKDEVEFDGNDLIIDGNKYEGTPGLWKLITSKVPESGFTDEDIEVYKQIMIKTDALRSEKDTRRPKLNRGYKWKNILKDLWVQSTPGKGRVVKTPVKGKKGKKFDVFSTPSRVFEGEGIGTPKGRVCGTPRPGVVYLPSSPEELLKELHFAFASNQAGNSGERNKIVSILDTLLSMREIGLDAYKKFNLAIK